MESYTTPTPEYIAQYYYPKKSRRDIAIVYGKVWRYCQMSEHVCRETVGEMAKQVSMSEDLFSKCLEILVKDGFLKEHTKPKLRNRPHIYSVTGKLVLLFESKPAGSGIENSDKPPVADFKPAGSGLVTRQQRNEDSKDSKDSYYDIFSNPVAVDIVKEYESSMKRQIEENSKNAEALKTMIEAGVTTEDFKEGMEYVTRAYGKAKMTFTSFTNPSIIAMKVRAEKNTYTGAIEGI